MTNISYNLSGKIDPILVDVLQVINQEALSRGMLYFVVGATARDILLNHCHAIWSNRATRDLDIGVEVAGWDEFRQLSEALVATGKFTPTNEPHRLMYGPFPVDIVPYGGVSPDNQTISWPPDHQVIMNIMGFQEAYEYGMTVRLNEDPLLDVKVPTIPGMALMKIISWNDRYPERPKDAEDLLFLMDHYAEAGNLDRLYDDEVELLQQEEFDQTLTGIRLLGRDMVLMATAATAEAIIAILEAETEDQGRYRLVLDMARGAHMHDRFDDMKAKLEKLKQGFLENYQGTAAA
jgi:predicted nucleotidyltransferase